MPTAFRCLAACLMFLPLLASAQTPDAQHYLEFGGGSVRFDRQRAQTLYSATAHWTINDFAFIEIDAASSSGDNISFDRQQIVLGLQHPLTDFVQAFGSVGVERTESDARLQFDFAGAPYVRHLRRSQQGLSANVGVRWQISPRFDLTVGGGYRDRHFAEFQANLPQAYGELAVETRLTRRFSVVVEARSGQDYREYRISPRFHF